MVEQSTGRKLKVLRMAVSIRLGNLTNISNSMS